jgi:transmembrane sensor
MQRRQAARWLARLQSGRDPTSEAKFKRWCEAHPENAAAFERVRRSYNQAALLRHSRSLAPGQRERATPASRSRLRPALTAAAALVVLVPVAIMVARGNIWSPADTEAVMLTTRVGEIRQVALVDGSRVTLDTATGVEVEIHRARRNAQVRYGRARFQIVRGSEPFLVEIANTRVATREGTVDVEQVGEESHVQVLAGTADVRRVDERQVSSRTVAAGERVTVTADGTERTALATPSDWINGMLQFDRTPVAQAVALANRYSPRHIILAGDVSPLRVTGAFRAGDPDGFAKALAQAFGLSLRRSAEGDLVLSRGRSSPNRR